MKRGPGLKSGGEDSTFKKGRDSSIFKEKSSCWYRTLDRSSGFFRLPGVKPPCASSQGEGFRVLKGILQTCIQSPRNLENFEVPFV